MVLLLDQGCKKCVDELKKYPYLRKDPLDNYGNSAGVRLRSFICACY